LLTLACEGDKLVGLWIGGQKYHGGAIAEAMIENSAMPVFTAAKRWLNSYFAGKKPAASELPLAPIGGEFRQGIWDILREIPYGEVITYGGISKIMAAKMHKESMSSQAVGGAVGHNPIAIIIPCHRVVGSNGSLTGYAAGVATKVKLLELEGVDISSLFVPKRGTAL
jgi:methylated-DNA-[protein]-cysteine S-methyltransferase